MDALNIGKFIQNLRRKNNLTQKEFADLFGVTFQAVSKWENGKSIPDIMILKEICKKYNVDINELLGEKKIKKNPKRLNLIFIFLICNIFIGLIVFYFFKTSNNNDDFQFKTISSSCSNFNITGSVAFNDNKSHIYISKIEYCGGDDVTKYKKIECRLYETHGDFDKKLGAHTTKENETNITLEEFLKDLSFNVDNFCNNFNDANLFLQISATDKNNKVTSYKIALNNKNSCHLN